MSRKHTDHHHMDDDYYANETDQFFNLVPNTTYEIFRDPISSPRTPDETERLTEATATRKPLAELPPDIINLFYEQEAFDYMENTIDFLFTALHKKEKYLHLSEVTRGSFQFDRSLSIPSQAAGLVRTILR